MSWSFWSFWSSCVSCALSPNADRPPDMQSDDEAQRPAWNGHADCSNLDRTIRVRVQDACRDAFSVWAEGNIAKPDPGERPFPQHQAVSRSEQFQESIMASRGELRAIAAEHDPIAVRGMDLVGPQLPLGDEVPQSDDAISISAGESRPIDADGWGAHRATNRNGTHRLSSGSIHDHQLPSGGSIAAYDEMTAIRCEERLVGTKHRGQKSVGRVDEIPFPAAQLRIAAIQFFSRAEQIIPMKRYGRDIDPLRVVVFCKSADVFGRDLFCRLRGGALLVGLLQGFLGTLAQRGLLLFRQLGAVPCLPFQEQRQGGCNQSENDS